MRTIGPILMFALLALPACGSKKDGDKPDTAKSAEKPKEGEPKVKTPDSKTPDTPVGDATKSAGVEAGGITHDADEGAAAKLSAADGTVEVRRVGEAEFAPAKQGDD